MEEQNIRINKNQRGQAPTELPFYLQEVISFATAALWEGDCGYSHLVEEETEAERGQGLGLWSYTGGC